LVETNLIGATLTDCRVYGISAWNVKFSKTTKQHDLVITAPDEPQVTVDNIEVAQFVYLLLHNEKRGACLGGYARLNDHPSPASRRITSPSPRPANASAAAAAAPRPSQPAPHGIQEAHARAFLTISANSRRCPNPPQHVAPHGTCAAPPTAKARG
jgi:hypothetical protein